MQTPIDANELEPARMFYGWQVVYALCLATTFTSGLISTIFPFCSMRL